MKVRAKKFAEDWFGSYRIKKDNIYTFPNIILDNKDELNLNPKKHLWEKQFEFIEENTEPNYEIY